jgi:hypothetical protein
VSDGAVSGGALLDGALSDGAVSSGAVLDGAVSGGAVAGRTTARAGPPAGMPVLTGSGPAHAAASTTSTRSPARRRTGP